MQKNQIRTVSKAKKAHKMYYEDGLSSNEIAKSFGVSGRTILNWIEVVDEENKEKKVEQLELIDENEKKPPRNSGNDKKIQKKKAKKKAKKKSKKKPEITKKEFIFNWLKEYPNGTHSEFKKDNKKPKLTAAYFNNIKRQHKKNGVKENKPSKALTTFKTMQTLLDENEFLVWWNEGERKGHVDKLLERLQNS